MRLKNKDLQALAKEAERQGWTVEIRPGGHLRWTPPDGQDFVVSSQSPSDPWAVRCVRRDLKKRGFED